MMSRAVKHPNLAGSDMRKKSGDESVENYLALKFFFATVSKLLILASFFELVYNANTPNMPNTNDSLQISFCCNV